MKFPIIPSESREVTTDDGTFIVRRYGIVSTPCVVYEAWEKQDAGSAAGRHATITHDESHGWLGKVTTRPNEPSIEMLTAGSEQRVGAVRDLLRDLRRVSLVAIEAAYPDVMSREGARKTDGRIETYENVPDDESPAALSALDRDCEAREMARGGEEF